MSFEPFSRPSGNYGVHKIARLRALNLPLQFLGAQLPGKDHKGYFERELRHQKGILADLRLVMRKLKLSVGKLRLKF